MSSACCITMSDKLPSKTFRPLTKRGRHDRSVVIGAPEGFDLGGSLGEAKEIRIAVAFGHLSGWKLVKDPIAQSDAATIRILLGTAFFQTEPGLLSLLLNLSKSQPALEVRLANSQSTFHPKVWILEKPGSSICIVGSGNLSKGGLSGNVECSIYSDNAVAISDLKLWFDYHWKVATKLSDGLEKYTRKYEELKQQRSILNAKLRQAMAEIAAYQGQAQKRSALESAQSYWGSQKGKAEMILRQKGLESMREALDFPTFNFGEADLKRFISIDEFGRIVQLHNRKILAEIDTVKAGLRLSIQDVDRGFDALMSVSGIGNNIATKLLVMCDPDRFVVYNSRVESALEVFGISTKNFEQLNSSTYREFLKEVKAFCDASDALGLNRASALDTFFYEYSDIVAD